MQRFSTAPRRATILHKLEAARKISPSGRKWVLAALDPFHDYQEDIAGYPDADGSLSNCQWVVKSLEVSKPAGTTGNWDCAVANFPLQMTCIPSGVTQVPVGAGSLYRVGEIIFPATTVATDVIDSLTVSKADAGASLWDPAAANWECEALSCKEPEEKSKTSRVIAFGFEVHNTTAELNKQGTVTVNEVSQTPDRSCIHTQKNGDDTRGGPREWYFFRVPPDTVGEAIRFPNALQWKAADGVYAVPSIQSDAMPVSKPINASLCGINHNDVPGSDTSGIVLCSECDYDNSTPAGWGGWRGGWMQPAHFNTVSAIFSGLSEETTLTVTMRALVEYFPYVGDTLLPSATPSPSLDSVALRLYADAIRSLPAAVPVDMNAKGDWFRMVGNRILNSVEEMAPVAGALADFVIPGAAAAGAAVSSSIAAGKAITKAKKKRRQQRNQRMLSK